MPVFGAILFLAMTGQGLSGKSDTTIEKVPFDSSKWKLEWSDEFNKGDQPDSRNWSYEQGYIRNDEKQFYTKSRKENARIENGNLIIQARLDNFESHEITSASINTSGKHSFLYGRIEARAQFPVGIGTWPAIWTLGENIGKVGWPKCGEIDILENVGFDPNRVHANIHVDAYNHMKGTGRGNNMAVEAPSAGFHTYAIEWYPDRLEFFYDDTRYFIFRKEQGGESVWPFDKPQYLIINLAIGGAWGGQKGIDKSSFPHTYRVDYVRYYKQR